MANNHQLVELQQAIYQSKNPTRRWLHQTRREWVFDAIRRCAEQGSTDKALEVGPGSGLYLPKLAERYSEVTASDIEEAYLEHVRQMATDHPNLRFAVDDITDTKLPAESFDVILCSEVVEHIPDSAPAIASMARLLKPGGTLILSTPQVYSPLEVTSRVAYLPGVIQMVRLIYREPILNPGHINLMTAGKVRRQLHEAGLEIAESFKSGMYVPLWAEFTGGWGQRVLANMESTLRGGRLDWLLWTQYYLARKAQTPNQDDQ